MAAPAGYKRLLSPETCVTVTVTWPSTKATRTFDLGPASACGAKGTGTGIYDLDVPITSDTTLSYASVNDAGAASVDFTLAAVTPLQPFRPTAKTPGRNVPLALWLDPTAGTLTFGNSGVADVQSFAAVPNTCYAILFAADKATVDAADATKAFPIAFGACGSQTPTQATIALSKAGTWCKLQQLSVTATASTPVRVTNAFRVEQPRVKAVAALYTPHTRMLSPWIPIYPIVLFVGTDRTLPATATYVEPTTTLNVVNKTAGIVSLASSYNDAKAAVAASASATLDPKFAATLTANYSIVVRFDGCPALVNVLQEAAPPNADGTLAWFSNPQNGCAAGSKLFLSQVSSATNIYTRVLTLTFSTDAAAGGSDGTSSAPSGGGGGSGGGSCSSGGDDCPTCDVCTPPPKLLPWQIGLACAAVVAVILLAILVVMLIERKSAPKPAS
jgi:hypothetical protein